MALTAQQLRRREITRLVLRVRCEEGDRPGYDVDVYDNWPEGRSYEWMPRVLHRLGAQGDRQRQQRR